ncbi:MAG TPA: hypothetical protein PKA28_08385 [Methylomusa anaerophila]|uniref:Uncharacterized protein n=1 Tax=Methylomusa anaerophila TaxID=1930071 RepID=A0A348AL67_9FIRM|nr:hypothetical protein [Methylomusa anaerophila]BBB91815.1 hypothetical protein MAMMFC1_02500 [Methylomusa anaerophila]HML88451.1 hypothetical protein [Methylomusa anaerophila]
MSSDATVFSQIYHRVFEKSYTIRETEGLLRDFVGSIGKALSHNEIILGHIKILAKLPEPAAEYFITLSLTRLDQIDVTPSEHWRNGGGVILDSLELYVNVLIFGHTISAVEKVVTETLKDLGTGSTEWKEPSKNVSRKVQPKVLRGKKRNSNEK